MQTLPSSEPVVAVLIPCLNEEAAIGQTVRAFRSSMPKATVYVYDNDSTDGTVQAATNAGARVFSEPLRGKGNVVRRMFADVEADVYVLVDGDATYDATIASSLVERLVNERLDMINVARVTEIREAYRPGHRFGNLLLTGLVGRIFGRRVKDMLSGYRVFSRRFVKSFPALASGFETETELTVHALELRMPIAEAIASYKDRPSGSASKLNTFRDGWRILRTIVALTREERPLAFFFSVCALLLSLALVVSAPLFITYLETGQVPRFPTAILATGMVLLAFLSLLCGLVLDTVTRGRRELKRLHYLAIPLFPSRYEAATSDASADASPDRAALRARSGEAGPVGRREQGDQAQDA